MRRIKEIIQTGGTAIVVASSLAVGLAAPAQADPANVPSLVISQLKITSSNGQFITLYNSTDAAMDMSKYQLEYFNNYDLGKATSSKLVSLSGIVPPHGYFMVNDGSLLLCYQLTVDSVSLGLSSTAGLVEVLAFNQSSPGSSVNPVLEDYVGWSKTGAGAAAQTLPANTDAFLQRQPVDAANNPAVDSSGSGSWQTVQPDTANACELVGAGGSSTIIPTGLAQLLPSAEPPATILSLDSGSAAAPAATPSLPSADIGLMAPKITELLPNPDGTGNDSTDEFIEIYNPNGVKFDLSGFGLQVGITSLHNYNFVSGTSLPPKSFTAFYSAATGLSLSNSGGQAKLLDPFGNSISATDVYGTAKDGQAWALANGKWYWTIKLTPGAANIINQPPASKKAAAKSKAAKGTAAQSAAKAKGAAASAAASDQTSDDQPAAIPIHPWTLALVGAAALLYGAYEYRADLANRIYQFRSYLRTRRTDGA